MQIRPEQEQDRTQVYRLNAAAFPGDAEAKLVDALRREAAPIVSLIASIDGEIVGHILFTPVTHSAFADAFIMGLAPMAVAEKARNRGIGTALARSGMAACAELGAGALVVLGDAGYYSRFGFGPASHFGLECEYDVPDDAFMAIELVPRFLAAKPGTIRYHDCFSSL